VAPTQREIEVRTIDVLTITAGVVCQPAGSLPTTSACSASSAPSHPHDVHRANPPHRPPASRPGPVWSGCWPRSRLTRRLALPAAARSSVTCLVCLAVRRCRQLA